MAIALDNTLVGTGNGNGVNSITLSNFSTGGANRLVLVESDESQDTSTISSVTATGLTFTKVTSINKGTSQGNVEIWGAIAASTQTSVAITVNYANTNFPQCSVRTHCFSGTVTTSVAAAVGAVNSSAFASGTNPSLSVTTTGSNSQVVGMVGTDSAGTITAGSGVTSDGTNNGGSVSTIASLRETSITTISGTNVTLSATLGTSAASGLLVIELLAPSVGATTGGTYTGMRIPNKFVGPMALRYNFKQPPAPTPPRNSTAYTQPLTAAASFSGAMPRQTSRALAASLNFGGYGVHVAVNPIRYSDNFNNNLLDTVMWSAAGSADSTQVKNQNSRLEITHSTGPQYNELAAAFTTYNLTSNSTYVQVVNAGNQALTSHQAIFGTRIDANNRVFMAATAGNLAAFKVVASTQTQIGANITYSSSTHAWWRIRESGGTTFFDTAPDSSGTPGTWTNQWSVANPIAVTALYPFLQSGCFNTEASTSLAYFDNMFFPDNTSSTTLATFTTDAGRHPSMVNIFTAWGATGGYQLFQPSFADGIVATGATPFITWEPWVAGGGATQATYTLANIIAGNFDTYINTYAQALKSWGGLVYLRFAHEMNGTWYPWAEGQNGNTTGQYASAWKHVYNTFMANNVPNVRWVWCVNTDFSGSVAISGLYPGDGYVDIAAIDLYNYGTAGTLGWQSFATAMGTTYSNLLAVASNKPLWITEIGCAEAGGSKAAWITDFIGTQLAVYNRIQTFLWFNESTAPADTRIETSASATDAFKQAVAQWPDNLAKTPRIPLSAALSFVGSIPTRAIKHVFTAGVSFVGNLNRLTKHAFTGALSFTGAFGRGFFKTVTGALSFAGNFITGTAHHAALTASLAFSGAFNKSTQHLQSSGLSFSGAFLPGSIITYFFNAALSFSGAINRQTSRSLPANLSFAGSFVTGAVHRLALAAALSFTGAFNKSTKRLQSASLSFTGTFLPGSIITYILSASLGFSGAINRQTNKALAGGVSFSGAISRATRHAFAAAVSFAGALGTGTVNLVALVASLSFSGSVNKMTSRGLLGGLSFTGAINRAIARALAAAVSFSGAFNKLTTRAYAGAVSFAGAFSEGASHALTFVASISFSGTFSKRAGKTLPANLSFSGSMNRAIVAVFTAALSFIGNLPKSTQRGLTASVSFVGNFIRSFFHMMNMTASVSFTGGMSRLTSKGLPANLSFTGSINRLTKRSVAAAVNFTGVMVKTAGAVFTAAVSFVGVFIPGSLITVVFNAVLSFTGAIKRSTSRSNTGSLSFSGTTNKSTRRSLSGNLSLSGLFGRGYAKVFTGTLSFSGSMGKGIRAIFQAAVGFAGNLFNGRKTTPPTIPEPLTTIDRVTPLSSVLTLSSLTSEADAQPLSSTPTVQSLSSEGTEDILK